MQLTLTLRDLEPEDLPELDWSGGPEHLAALAAALPATWAGQQVVLVAALPNGRLVAHGSARWVGGEDFGLLETLAVHEICQGLGVGSWLVAALEERVRATGRRRARIAVEQDNPRAAALYRRLGFAEIGSLLQTWPTSTGRTYVTVSALLQKVLDPPG